MVRVITDLALGGRWTSLRAGGREWLWHRAEPRRASVRPGEDFADAGGLEECVPTVRGTPDHGDAWTRVWRPDGDAASVRCPDFRLTRRLRSLPGAVVAEYRLAAAPGYRFLWAAHALLDVSPEGRIAVPDGTPSRLFRDGGSRWEAFTWPAAPGVRFDRLGPDDGTALGAIAATAGAAVHDGPDTIRFAVEAPGQPVSVAVWRNLGGFPEAAPYRSIGVEPMLGRVFDLAAAGEGDTARVPDTGEVRWRLTITAAP